MIGFPLRLKLAFFLGVAPLVYLGAFLWVMETEADTPWSWFVFLAALSALGFWGYRSARWHAAQPRPRAAAVPPAPRRALPLRLMLGVLALVMVSLISLDVLRNARGVDAFHRFETTEGRVLSVGMQQLAIHPSSKYRGQFPTTYRSRPAVEYTFVVDGRTQGSARVFLFDHRALSDWPPDNKWAAWTRDSFKPGQRVPVTYAKSDPRISYLEPGWQYFEQEAAGWLIPWLFWSVALCVVWLVSLMAHIGSARPAPDGAS